MTKFYQGVLGRAKGSVGDPSSSWARRQFVPLPAPGPPSTKTTVGFFTAPTFGADLDLAMEILVALDASEKARTSPPEWLAL